MFKLYYEQYFPRMRNLKRAILSAPVFLLFVANKKIAASRLVFCTFCEKYAAPDVFPRPSSTYFSEEVHRRRRRPRERDSAPKCAIKTRMNLRCCRLLRAQEMWCCCRRRRRLMETPPRRVKVRKPRFFPLWDCFGVVIFFGASCCFALLLSVVVRGEARRRLGKQPRDEASFLCPLPSV